MILGRGTTGLFLGSPSCLMVPGVLGILPLHFFLETVDCWAPSYGGQLMNQRIQEEHQNYRRGLTSCFSFLLLSFIFLWLAYAWRY